MTERPAIDPVDGEARPGVGRLTLLYVAALSTVAVLSLGAQALIQRQLDVGESDSRVINVAGRQRMLSQRLAKATLRVAHAPAANRSTAKQELTETLQEWCESHEALQQGDKQRGLPGQPSPAVTALYEKIEPNYLTMRAAAAELTTSDITPDRMGRFVDMVQENEGPFLAGMDQLVSQYVAEAEARVTRLRRLEFAILVGTLAVLLAEGLFIFRPAVRQIGKTFLRLQDLSHRLGDAKTQAEKASAAKTRFLANVSHELRTPMTAVLGMTELARKTDDDRQRSVYLATVEEAGESLLSLLNDLIDVARIDADVLQLSHSPFRPAIAAERATRMLTHAAQTKGLEIRLSTSDEDQPYVLGDESRLVQVLANLIANAIKWTDTGVIEVTCDCEITATDHARVTYSVRDQGEGIPADAQQRIFSPFTQAEHAIDSTRGGVGLGLAICQRIITAMGGEISLSSEVGQGTEVRVEVELPIGSAPTETTPMASPVIVPRRVLLVEDTEVNRVFIRETLTAAGHEVIEVSDGESALDACEKFPFDVALVDLQLPGIDGGATAQTIRELAGEEIKILCLTAHTDTREAAAKSACFDAFLTKPIRGADLLRHIATATADLPLPDAEDESLRAELAETFCRVADQQLDELRKSLDRDDLASIRVIAHRLRSQVAYFDAPQLEAALGALEKAAQDGDAPRVRRVSVEALGGCKQLITRLGNLTPAKTA